MAADPRILLVDPHPHSEPAKRLRDVLARSPGIVSTYPSADALGVDLVDDPAKRPGLIVLGPDVPAPLGIARRLAKLAPEVRLLVAAGSADAEARLRREAIYSAPPGGRLSIVGADAPDLSERIAGLLAGLRQQVKLRTTLDRMKRRLAAPAIVDANEYRRLRVSDRYLASILQHARDAIVTVDATGRVATWNEGASRLFGRAAHQAIGARFADMFHDPDAVEALIRTALVAGACDGSLACGDADHRHVDAGFSAISDPVEGFVGVVAILHDVTDRQRAEEAMQAAARQKDDFLAMLAHELRNPLAPIRNATQILKMIDPPDHRIRSALGVIDRQTQHLGALLDDLLDVARVTRGAIALDRRSTSVDDIVADACEQARSLIETKRHRLAVTRSEPRLHVLGDRKRLVQVIANLLVNAAKYTDEGGSIALAIAAEPERVMISVTDNGIGMDAPLLDRVFELFVQKEQALDRAQGGLGIGLAIARSLVAMHGGSITAKSAGPGRGSTVAVTLPRAPTPPLPQPNASALEPGSEQLALTLMVVDDNVDSAQTLGFLLETEGHTVEVATDPRHALARAQQAAWDAFLLDLGMPGMDGYELARAIRALPHTRPPLLVAITGYGSAADRQKSREAGFDDHLTKPVDIVALTAVLQRHGRSLRTH
jgi:PAS domain S-box-containing protein